MREKGLREKRVQRGKPTGKRREGGCRILLRFSFSPLSLSQEVFLFGKQEVAIIRQIRYNHLRADDIRPYNTKPRRLRRNPEVRTECAPTETNLCRGARPRAPTVPIVPKLEAEDVPHTYRGYNKQFCFSRGRTLCAPTML